MGWKRKDLGKSVFPERKLEGGGRGMGTQSQGRATRTFLLETESWWGRWLWVFILCGLWNSPSRFSTEKVAFPFFLLTFVINASDPVLSIMVPLSQNVDWTGSFIFIMELPPLQIYAFLILNSLFEPILLLTFIDPPPPDPVPNTFPYLILKHFSSVFHLGFVASRLTAVPNGLCCLLCSWTWWGHTFLNSDVLWMSTLAVQLSCSVSQALPFSPPLTTNCP